MFLVLDTGETVNTNAIKFIADYKEPSIGDITTLGPVPAEFESTIHFLDGTLLHTTMLVKKLNDLFGLGRSNELAGYPLGIRKRAI
jgi:hypothetical protein